MSNFFLFLYIFCLWPTNVSLMINMMMNWICGMVDPRKALSLISSRDRCQRSAPSRISNTPRAGFELEQSLSSSFAEWSCAVVITTTPRHHRGINKVKKYDPFSRMLPNLAPFSKSWCLNQANNNELNKKTRDHQDL